MRRPQPPGAVLALTLVVLLVAPLTGCRSKTPVTGITARPPLSVEVKFDPTPVHVGEEQITVSVRDQTGAPVTGATVKIFPSFETVAGGHWMPMPGMGRADPASRARDDGDGTYHADVRLNEAAHWIFGVEVTTRQAHATIQRGVEVK